MSKCVQRSRSVICRGIHGSKENPRTLYNDDDDNGDEMMMVMMMMIMMTTTTMIIMTILCISNGDCDDDSYDKLD